MPFNNSILTSIYGRRLGLMPLSSGQSGSSRGPMEFLVGPDDFRAETTTADTTGVNLKPAGEARLNGTSVASSAVYVLDPPIPGVRKVLAVGSSANGPMYVKTANGETLNFAGTTTIAAGSSFTTLKLVQGAIELRGGTTGQWEVLSPIGANSISTTT